jgi:hypothetical protein
MPFDASQDYVNPTDLEERIATLELRLERIRMHVTNAKACGQGNPLAYVDAFKEIEKLVL